MYAIQKIYRVNRKKVYTRLVLYFSTAVCKIQTKCFASTKRKANLNFGVSFMKFESIFVVLWSFKIKNHFQNYWKKDKKRWSIIEIIYCFWSILNSLRNHKSLYIITRKHLINNLFPLGIKFMMKSYIFFVQILDILFDLCVLSKCHVQLKNGDWPWPPRSPDLTVCDFFLWGHVKQNIGMYQETTSPIMWDSSKCNKKRFYESQLGGEHW